MTLPRETWAAIEADLLHAGFTLDDLGGRVSWRAVKAFVAHSPQDSAVFQEVNGKDALWDLPAQLLALIADILSAANYQRGGGKGKKPKPIPRPGVKSEVGNSWGTEAMPASEFNEWWSNN